MASFANFAQLDMSKIDTSPEKLVFHISLYSKLALALALALALVLLDSEDGLKILAGGE